MVGPVDKPHRNDNDALDCASHKMSVRALPLQPGPSSHWAASGGLWLDIQPTSPPGCRRSEPTAGHNSRVDPSSPWSDRADYLLTPIAGGVLADTFDKRRLLMAVQGFLVMVGAVLAALTFGGQTPPDALSIFTFLDRLRTVITPRRSGAPSGPRTPRPLASTRLRCAFHRSGRQPGEGRGPAIAAIMRKSRRRKLRPTLRIIMHLPFLLVTACDCWPPQPQSLREYLVLRLRGWLSVRAPRALRIPLPRATLFLVPAMLWALLLPSLGQRLAQALMVRPLPARWAGATGAVILPRPVFDVD